MTRSPNLTVELLELRITPVRLELTGGTVRASLLAHELGLHAAEERAATELGGNFIGSQRFAANQAPEGGHYAGTAQAWTIDSSNEGFNGKTPRELTFDVEGSAAAGDRSGSSTGGVAQVRASAVTVRVVPSSPGEAVGRWTRVRVRSTLHLQNSNPGPGSLAHTSYQLRVTGPDGHRTEVSRTANLDRELPTFGFTLGSVDAFDRYIIVGGEFRIDSHLIVTAISSNTGLPD